MSDAGWMGWVRQNPVPAIGFSLCLLVTSANLGVISARVGDDDGKTVAAGATTTTGAEADATTTTETTVAESTTTTAGARTTATTARGGTRTTPGPTTTLPGQPPAPPCQPDPNYKATGITPTQVTIGQIVTDVNQLPQQLRPNYEGLQAYVKLVNDAGGVCGRTIKIDYENDNLNPALHNYRAMTHRVFAFVANSSLIDGGDYEQNKPFNPVEKDNGEYVPDVGGLAYNTSRSQSPWHAGVIGSISPSLRGGSDVRWLVQDAAQNSPHGACRKAGIVYLDEPTGASEDQADQGGKAVAAEWGGNLGTANVKMYQASLAQPTPVYQQTVRQMVADGVNCVFVYADLQSNVNLVNAMKDEGVWPPGKCTRAIRSQCFSLVWVPFSGYDKQFVDNTEGGDAGVGVSTHIPHIPLDETSGEAMQTYLKALKAVNKDFRASTFSIIGYTSGMMFVEALQACGAAPTRLCVMEYLRNLKDFTAGGLLGGTTPFRTTRVACNGDCGNFSGKGIYDWKWIFHCWTMMRVGDRGGVRDFYRVHPGSGYSCEDLRVVRGTPA